MSETHRTGMTEPSHTGRALMELQGVVDALRVELARLTGERERRRMAHTRRCAIGTALYREWVEHAAECEECAAALGGPDTATRCEGRYPVPETAPARDEPFNVTYRCALPKGHAGAHMGPPPSEGPMVIDQDEATALARAYIEDDDRGLDVVEVMVVCRALVAAEQAREHLATQLGLVYWHVSGGELSKPYDFKAVESRIDDHLNEFYGKEAREAEERAERAEAALRDLDAVARRMWQDIKDWTHTARGLLASVNALGVIRGPVPHQRGIDESERILDDGAPVFARVDALLNPPPGAPPVVTVVHDRQAIAAAFEDAVEDEPVAPGRKRPQFCSICRREDCTTEHACE